MVPRTVYTIKQASARTGLGAPLIRAWERRYGVIAPARTSAGYRLYDESSIRTLLAMRTLIEGGWSASEAARGIRAGEVSVEALAGGTTVDASPVSWLAAHRGRLIERFVAAAEAASPAETEAVLDEILGAGSFEAVVDDLLLPAAAALGDAWAAGRLSAAAEHAASAAVARRLAAAFQASAAPGRATVVVGLPPGSRHELGALGFAVALRRRGVGVLYLGPDVPVADWLDVVRRTRARMAVVGVVTEDDRAAARDVAHALGEEPAVALALGGGAASADLASPDRGLLLPERVVDAAAVVAHAVGRRGRGAQTRD
jgi:DNA-binding transcriptional MerR regulator